MPIYDVNGAQIDVSGTIDYDIYMRGVNHRGYCDAAPENTLPAYQLSKKMGFKYVETDVSFTSDGVAVLLHDATIDRTSNGTGAISSMTYADVLQYDFGSWKDESYAGTKIPTLRQFLALCKRLGLYPYIELKSNGNYTQAQIEEVVDMVHEYEMEDKTSYISFSDTYLGYVIAHDEYARVGYLDSNPTSSALATLRALQTGKNKVFYDVKSSNMTIPTAELIVGAIKGYDIALEIWTINDEPNIMDLVSNTESPLNYITGVTSNCLIAGKVLYEAGMAQ